LNNHQPPFWRKAITPITVTIIILLASCTPDKPTPAPTTASLATLDVLFKSGTVGPYPNAVIGIISPEKTKFSCETNYKGQGTIYLTEVGKYKMFFSITFGSKKISPQCSSMSVKITNHNKVIFSGNEKDELSLWKLTINAEDILYISPKEPETFIDINQGDAIAVEIVCK
jgi:hypothetical protein